MSCCTCIIYQGRVNSSTCNAVTECLLVYRVFHITPSTVLYGNVGGTLRDS